MSRRAWGRSLVVVVGAALAVLGFVAFSGSLALSDLVPFLGGDDGLSIGSEALAGPVADEDGAGAGDTSTDAAGGANMLTPAESDDSGEDGGDEEAPVSTTAAPSTTGSSSSSTSSASSSSTGSTADTTPTSTSTTDGTVTTSTTTGSSTSSVTQPTTTTTTSTTTTTTSTSTPTTASTVPPDLPVIVRFISPRVDGQCAIRGHEPFEARWATENTTSVELTLPDGSIRTGKPTGSARFCAEPGSSISLRAIGPGGEVKETITI